MSAFYSLQEHQTKKLISKDGITEMVGSIQPITREQMNVLSESAKGKKGKRLIVKMEAIHVGRTKNFTYYTEEGLRAGLHTWTQPYNKPVLTHHNEYDGEPIGRILEAQYEEATLSGKPGLVFTVEITDEQAQEKVLDGRYATVSIGASTNKITCNICGTDRTEDWCDHYPGESYGEGDDKQTAHFIVGETYGREVSYVNTPADENAGNRSIQVIDENTGTKESVQEKSFMQIFQVAEGLMQSVNQPEHNLYNSLNESARNVLDSLINIKESGGTKMNDQTQEPVQTQESGPQSEPQNVNTQESVKTTIPDTFTEAQVREELAKKLEENAKLRTELQEARESLTKAVIEKDKFVSRVEEMEGEHTRILAENAQLLENEHKMLATRVVEMKQRLCKVDVVGKETEECVAEHITRTKESLNDSLNELLVEMKTAKPAAGSVTNPGLVVDENLDNEKQTKTYSLKEAEDMIKRMFSRNKR